MQLSIDLATASGFDERQRARAMARLAPRMSGTLLTVAVTDERSQRQNRAVAREALAPDVPRRATKPTRGSQRRRLDSKKRRGDVKQARRRPGTD